MIESITPNRFTNRIAITIKIMEASRRKGKTAITITIPLKSSNRTELVKSMTRAINMPKIMGQIILTTINKTSHLISNQMINTNITRTNAKLTQIKTSKIQELLNGYHLTE